MPFSGVNGDRRQVAEGLCSGSWTVAVPRPFLLHFPVSTSRFQKGSSAGFPSLARRKSVTPTFLTVPLGLRERSPRGETATRPCRGAGTAARPQLSPVGRTPGALLCPRHPPALVPPCCGSWSWGPSGWPLGTAAPPAPASPVGAPSSRRCGSRSCLLCRRRPLLPCPPLKCRGSFGLFFLRVALPS